MVKDLQSTNNTINCKIGIITFAAMALCFGGLGNLIFLVEYIYYLFADFQLSTLFFSGIMILDFFISMMPCILLMVYCLFFYKKFNASVVMTLVYLSLAFPAFVILIGLLYDGVHLSDFFIDSAFVLLISQRIFFRVLPLLPFVVSAGLSFFGVKNRALHIVPFVIYSIKIVYSIFNYAINLFSFRDHFEFFWSNIGTPLEIIGEIFVIVTVLIFVMANNKLISILPVITEDEELKNLESEEALNLLKFKFNMGEITQEEYDEQRELIINKL